MTRMESLLDRADWVLNRGTNWKTKQKTKFSLTVVYRPSATTLRDIVINAYAEFIIAEILFEEGRLK